MVTYGGEQSLDRYLELSARGLPFNFAHAAGQLRNRARGRAGVGADDLSLPHPARIQLARPPRLCRCWSSSRSARERLDSSQSEGAEARAGAATWLRNAQGTDGGYAASPDQPSSPAMTGWVMLGLEAAGTNPLDLRSGGETPLSYLRSEVDRLRSVGDLERTILALSAAGIDPRSFAGEDLVANLRAKRDGDGSVDGQVNLTAFYALAMRAAGADSGSLKRSGQWLRGAQNSDGGWGIQPKALSEADSTGAALQGLVATGVAGKAADAGAGWLRRAQQRNGGWALELERG